GPVVSGIRAFGPNRALIDPGTDPLDLRTRERSEAERHAGTRTLPEYPLHQPALRRPAGQERRSAGAAFQCRTAGVQTQARLMPVGTVALVAGSLQDRLNVARELDAAARVSGSCLRGAEQ